jgi:hypothetical protein
MRLFELTEQYNQLRNMLDDTEDPQCILDTLESIEADIEDKVINIAKIKKELDAEAATIKVEEERLNVRRKSREAHADRLKQYLEEQLTKLGKDVKTPLMTVAMQKNGQSIKVLDEEIFKVYSENHYAVPQPVKVDRKAILEDMKAGAFIPGAEIFQGSSLRIR